MKNKCAEAAEWYSIFVHISAMRGLLADTQTEQRKALATMFLYGLKKRVCQKGGVGVIKQPSEERHQNIIGRMVIIAPSSLLHLWRLRTPSTRNRKHL